MLSVSQQFKDAFRSPKRAVEFKAVINGVEYSPKQIVDLTIADSIQNGSTFGIGTVFSTELSISLRTGDEIPVAAKVELYLRAAELTWDMTSMTWITADVPWDDPSTESIPYGVFYVDSRSQTSGHWKFTCYDAMLLAEQPFISALTYPATMAAVLAEACNLSGITSEVTVPSDLHFNVAPTGYTCRDVIRFVSQACSANAKINKVGKLVFIPFKPTETVETLTTNDYRKLTHTNAKKTISRVVCTVDDEGVALETGTGEADNTITINNPYLNQAAVNGIHAALNGFAYHPFNVDWICLPWIEVGDQIAIQEFTGGAWEGTGTTWDATDTPWNGVGVFTTVILNNTIKYRGGLTATISASSDSQQQSEFKPTGTLTQQINRLNTSAVKLGKPYYGLTVTKEQGLMVERSDGVSKVVLNSDKLAFQANGQDKLYFDPVAGKYKFDGELIAASGTFSGSLSAATGTFAGDISAASGTFSGTVRATSIDVSWGKITAGQIDADSLHVKAANVDGKLTAVQIETGQLIVGDNIQLGPHATISYSQVTNQPYIPTLPSYITSTKITSTTIESPTINGAFINGGVINVQTDAYVGNSLTIGDSSVTAANKAIYFYNNSTGQCGINVLKAGPYYAMFINAGSVDINAPYGVKINNSPVVNMNDLNSLENSLKVWVAMNFTHL